MAHEILVGLQVVDDPGYRAYREAMADLLAEHGGEFGYDFRVSEVLKSESEVPINRVFTLRFPDQAAKSAFFSNADYLAIRERYFSDSVADAIIIATYER